MLNPLPAIGDVDVWLSDTQVSEYLERIEVTRQLPILTFLQEIVSGTTAHLPFQNLAMLIDERKRPSPEQICSDMVSGRGGLCTIRNPFLFHLFTKLGFNVRYVAATIEKPECHIALIVDIDGDDWWVDVGNGFPYMQPIRLGDTESVQHPFLEYRLAFSDDCWQIQHNRNGVWKTNYHFSSTGVDYSAFDRMHELHYQPGWGPFLTGLRVNRWWGGNYAILRDNRATSPDGEEILDTPEQVRRWITKWFPKAGFLDSVNVVEAFYVWKFEIGLIQGSKVDIDQVHQLVGGDPENRGPMQLELMRHVGLRPHHSLLDFGCGTLRGGIHLIPFLQPERYSGVDTNPLFVRIANRLVAAKNMQHLKPTISALENFDPRHQFDFILTLSVLNHLQEDQVLSLAEKIELLLKHEGTWISTVCYDSNINTIQINSSHPFRPNESLNSRFHPEWFESLLQNIGFSVEVISDFNHPHQQFSLIKINRKMEEK